jgi:hypothetical protein
MSFIRFMPLLLICALMACQGTDTSTPDTTSASDTSAPPDTAKPSDSTSPADTTQSEDTGTAADTTKATDTALPTDTITFKDTSPPTDTVPVQDTSTPQDTIPDAPMCTPQCADKSCGDDDGCGGTCTACPADTNTICIEGLCMDPAFSCVGKCGLETANAPCQCHPKCFETNNCCADICIACISDFPAQCACDKAGELLECGPTGCGEEIASCPQNMACSDGECVSKANGCNGIGIQGCCQGNTLILCDGGEFWTEHCEEDPLSGGSCGWEGNWAGGFYAGWYQCGYGGADPNGVYPLSCDDVCTPQCENKSCGDNGCGWVCGTCAEGQACVDGKCT